jgi:hypothetical protein
MADGCDTAGTVCVAHTSFLLIMAPPVISRSHRDSGPERPLVALFEQAHPHGACDAQLLGVVLGVGEDARCIRGARLGQFVQP